MSLVKHTQIQDDPTEHAALTSAKEQSASNQASKAFHGAHGTSHDAPAHCQDGKIAPSAYDLEKPVGWDIKEDVEDVEDC